MFHTQMGVGASNKNCFHIFGIDILLDHNGKAWLMEINHAPSLNWSMPAPPGSEEKTVISPLDKEVKTRIIGDAINII